MHAIYIGPVGQPKKETSMQSHGRAVSPKKKKLINYMYKYCLHMLMSREAIMAGMIDGSLAQPGSKHSVGSSLADVARVARSSLLDKLKRASRDPHPAAEEEYTTQQSQSTCLVGSGQGGRDQVPERGDAHDDLQRDEVDHAEHALLSVLGQHGAHAW